MASARRTSPSISPRCPPSSSRPIIGRHDGSGRPGLFDSVIQAAWSFCLALRARGLGTTWVTAALQDDGEGEGDPRASPTT